MQDQNFEALIGRLERRADANPRRYLFSVLAVALFGFAILGVAIGYSLLVVLLLAGLGALVIITGGKALLLVLKLGKVLVLLAVSAWFMVRSSFAMLFTRLPPPQGRELRREEAPELFARIDAIGRRMKGPAIHRVLLTDELNAAIVQHPALGLLGWEKNYLLLGLSLLQTLTEEEAVSVVAHEYGHLSGYHGRWNGFIYRLRGAWGRMQAMAEGWNNLGTRFIARLFRWYAPYFNAYTFVLARQNEYEADRAARDLTSPAAAQSALARVNVAALHEAEKFWPEVNRRVLHEPEPIVGKSRYWSESLMSGLDADACEHFLRKALARETDHLDTHPSLRDRLRALGNPDGRVVLASVAAPVTAASAWFGARLPAIQDELDAQWSSSVAESWKKRHAHLQERHGRRMTLEQKGEAARDEAEQWEYIDLLSELEPEKDVLPLLARLLETSPGHLSARFRRGAVLLQKGDEAGIADLEAVMQEDSSAILPGCERAWRFYQGRDAEKAAAYAERWRARNAYEDAVQQESGHLPGDAMLAPADLPVESVEQIRRLVAEHGKDVGKVWLLRRIYRSDNDVHDYLIAFEQKFWTYSDKSRQIVQALVDKPFPLTLFIVPLRSPTYKGFRKKIKTLGVEPLYQA